jgi:heterotetrameric sarcosine oxidase delta subunit
MLLIKCPWCGERAQTEFTYGGDATIERPPDPAAATDEAWHDYVYTRRNPRGRHLEYWHHSHGCRRWLKVVRDTLTHEILESGGMDLKLAEDRR